MIRYVIPSMCFLAMSLLYCMRMNLNVAMTVMVLRNSDCIEGGSGKQIPFSMLRCNSTLKNVRTFDWNTTTQQFILGSFYIGYTIMPMPGGWLAAYFGGKRVIAFAVLWTSIMTALIPVVAGMSVDLLIALRILDGLGQGLSVPGVYVILGKWAPPNERSTMISISLSGVCLGLIVSSYGSAWMCSSDLLGGWPFSFYAYSIASVVWTVLWLTLVYETPNAHPCISNSEREMINSSLNQTEQKLSLSVPWMEIFCSYPVLALTLCVVTYEFGCYSLLSEMPLFFTDVLGYNLGTAGVLTLIPNLLQFVIKFSCGYFADVIIRREYLSVLSTRKMFVAITLGVSSFFLILLNYFDGSATVIVVLVTIVYAIYGFDVAGIFSNPMDLSPPFAGIIAGQMMTASSITGFIGPLVLGTIIKDENTIQQWNVFFAVVAGIHIFGLVCFLAFSRGEEQEWSKNARLKEEEKRTLLRRY